MEGQIRMEAPHRAAENSPAPHPGEPFPCVAALGKTIPGYQVVIMLDLCLLCNQQQGKNAQKEKKKIKKKGQKPTPKTKLKFNLTKQPKKKNK